MIYRKQGAQLVAAVFALLFGMMLAVPSQAQPAPDSLWVRLMSGTGPSNAFDVEPLDDGSIVVCGTWTNADADPFDSDVWLIKFDTNGNLIWDRKYGGPGSQERGHGFTVTADGGFGISGSTLVPGEDSDLLIIKTDSLGNELWSTTLVSSYTDYGRDCEVTPEGDLFVCGWTEYNPQRKVALAGKVSGDDGSVIWQNYYDGGDKDQAWSAEILQDGNYAISGRTWSFGAPDRDAVILKLRPNGDVLGFVLYGGPAKDHIYEFQETPDGGFIGTGKTESFDVGEGDAWLLRYNSVGELLWVSLWGTPGIEFGRSVDCTDDGGYIMSGVTFVPGAGNQVLLAKADTDGNWLWHTSFGGIYMDDSWGVRQTPDGGYAVVGFTRSLNPQKLLVAKFEADNPAVSLAAPANESMHPGHRLTGMLSGGWMPATDGVYTITTEEPRTALPSSFTVHAPAPNPFNATTSVRVDLPEASDLTLELVNVNGQLVQTITREAMSAGSHRFAVHADGLASGVYFVRAMVPGQSPVMQKLVLVR